MMDWLGWDSLSYADQAAVLFFCTLFALIGGGSVLVAYAVFGISPRRAPTSRRREQPGRRIRHRPAPRPAGPRRRRKGKGKPKPKGRR